jgi:hypothetical protein
MKQVGVIGSFLFVGLLVFASLALAQALGIEAPLQQVGAEGWGTAIPVILGLTAALALVVAWLLHHAGLFMAIVMVIVVIYAVGFGIPAAITGAGLQWFF